ncbi:MAG: hypothetical protein ACM3SU_02180 [Acidobacteriota bacterium]
MRRQHLSALCAGAAALLLASACASSGKSRSDSSDQGYRTLQAVVTEREYEAPGSAGGGSFRGSGNYYLSFEAREDDKTLHYRFPVTQQQYFRYPEGTRVELRLDGDLLRDIHPAKE